MLIIHATRADRNDTRKRWALTRPLAVAIANKFLDAGYDVAITGTEEEGPFIVAQERCTVCRDALALDDGKCADCYESSLSR